MFLRPRSRYQVSVPSFSCANDAIGTARLEVIAMIAMARVHQGKNRSTRLCNNCITPARHLCRSRAEEKTRKAAVRASEVLAFVHSLRRTVILSTRAADLGPQRERSLSFCARAAPIAVFTSLRSSGGGRIAFGPSDSSQSSRHHPLEW